MTLEADRAIGGNLSEGESLMTRPGKGISTEQNRRGGTWMIDWIVPRQDKTARLAMKSSGRICSLGPRRLGERINVRCRVDSPVEWQEGEVRWGLP